MNNKDTVTILKENNLSTESSDELGSRIDDIELALDTAYNLAIDHAIGVIGLNNKGIETLALWKILESLDKLKKA